jgi:drug/metabolite transporter (DMT)-like permease
MAQDKIKFNPIFICLFSAALFGASTPASKVILGGIKPLTLAGLLYIGAALAVLPFSFKGGSSNLRKKPGQILKLAGAVISGGVIGPVLLLYGLSLAKAGSVALWLNFETVATAIIGWLFFREHLDKRTILAIGLVLMAGIVLAAPSGFGTLNAAILVAAGCVFWGMDNNLTATIDGYTPAQTTLVKGAVAGTFNLILGIFIEKGHPGAINVLSGLIVGALSYGFSILLYITGAQRLGATRSQMLFATSPFFGLIIAWFVLREPVDIYQVIAALIMGAGLFVLFSGRHAHIHFHDSITHVHGHAHDDDHHDHFHEGLDHGVQHVHEHTHDAIEHAHNHNPDLHHRHNHEAGK